VMVAKPRHFAAPGFSRWRIGSAMAKYYQYLATIFCMSSQYHVEAAHWGPHDDFVFEHFITLE